MADDLLAWVVAGAAVAEFIVITVLVIVTCRYAKATREIVEESVKDRRIRRIEKALEEFYYPLLWLRDLERYPYPPWAEFLVPEIYAQKIEAIERFWDGVERHQYLAGRGTIKVLDSFFKHSNHYWVRARVPEAKADLEAARRNLIAEVKKDIKVLEERLGKLYG